MCSLPPSSPSLSFQAARRQGAPSSEPSPDSFSMRTWSICYNRMFTDFGLSAIVVQRLKGPLEQKTNPANLLDFLGRLSEEMKQQEIPKTQKRSYVKKRLIEAFDLAL